MGCFHEQMQRAAAGEFDLVEKLKSEQKNAEFKMLAKILRKNIQAGSQDVTLQKEIELIECYLEIQKYRFGECIQYQVMVEDGLEQYHVFPLLLQPIVENSIIHGLEIKEGIGHINIDITRQNDKVCILIQDGRDGLEKLLRVQPDVVLVDIKMPGLPGIELIQAAREQDFEGYFVILTGKRYA